MKTALLCNGPSRVAFNSQLGYNYTIGCNIPWTEVDSTVILDVGVLDRWKEPCKFFASVNAWRECRDRTRFVDYFLGFVNTEPDYDSTGHAACRKLIELGSKQIDIYGCDSWWEMNTDSFTHKYLDTRPENMQKHVSVWRQRWYELLGANPQVTFNFIGAPDET
jgi:hypothetical protein